MARARDKTAQIGLWDSEVSLPKHDEICLWVYEHAEEVLRTLRPQLFRPDWIDADFVHGASSEAISTFRSNTERAAPVIVKKALEYTLTPREEGRGARSWRPPVGYGDVLLAYSAPFPEPQYNHRDAITSFELAHQTHELLIEVKTELPTLGELLRQLNLYSTAFQGRQAVVASDDRYADILREHGFGFMRFDPAWYSRAGGRSHPPAEPSPNDEPAADASATGSD